jgi:O-acetyl-ADP-ribose deacetylase (regulator of RNase III)
MIRQLETCIVNILEMATILGTDSVSIPAISTGIYSFPKELCASIMIERAS